MNTLQRNSDSQTFLSMRGDPIPESTDTATTESMASAWVKLDPSRSTGCFVPGFPLITL